MINAVIEPPSPAALPPKYAGFNVRMIASAIDMFMVTLVALPVIDYMMPPVEADIFAPAMVPENTQDLPKLIGAMLKIVIDNHLIERAAFSNFAQLFFIALYTLGFWFRYNNTPGKMLLRLEIRDHKTYELITRPQAVLRFAGYLVSFIPLSLGFIWIAFNKKHQGWHDKIAGTIVIVKPKKNKNKMP